jgi:membrane-associated phospholipid phosphatase
MGLSRSGQVLVLVLASIQLAMAGEHPKATNTAVAASAANLCTDLEGKVEACPTEPVSSVPLVACQPTPSVFRALPANILYDQAAFWTGPLRFRVNDLKWALPLAGVTAVTVASDTAIEPHLPTNTSTIKHARTFSDAGAVALAGAAGGTFLWGKVTHNDHLKETGMLSGEAVADSLMVSTALKYAFGRERPAEGTQKGNFWQGGDSFPSSHAAVAWSSATVLAHEYPGPLTKLLAYGGAAGVSLGRVIGQKHFSSDVLVGSALGWYFGRQVYRSRRTDSEIDQMWGTFDKEASASEEQSPHRASTYVPLESWVYSAFDNLAAKGYLQSAFTGMRPWTRSECARLTEEAGQLVADSEDADARLLYEALLAEFAPAERAHESMRFGMDVESIYTRVTGISGVPLADGYHFGQTIINDYGRPYREGFNAVSGISTSAFVGPLAFYLRGEYQHSPFAPGESDLVRSTTAGVDRSIPTPPPNVHAEVNRFHLLDAYVALSLGGNWQLLAGQQSLWWGPGYGGAMMFTNNSEPVRMVRISRVSPITLPGIGKWLGPIRTEAFFGQLQGQYFVYQPPDYRILTGSWTAPLDPQPYFHGEKFTVKPTPNLEIGVGLSVVFGGPGVPLTLKNFLRTFHNFSTGPYNNGDRKTAFQFSYRIPGLRNWLTLYTDSIAEDQPNPIAYPRQSAMNPGIHLSHFPSLNKLDLRVEAAYTDLPNDPRTAFYYTDQRYPRSYTNNGNLMGSWVGREGRGIQAWSTYSVAPRKTIQLGYRYGHVSRGFIPQGGLLNDFSVKSEWLLSRRWTASGFVQYEQWNFPLLSSTQQRNLTTAFQLSFTPRMKPAR